MYANGQGVTQDYLHSHMWFNLAASNSTGDDNQKAIQYRERMAKNLTPAQIVQAQQMARQCEAQIFKNCD
jgi:TPR repeat protein